MCGPASPATRRRTYDDLALLCVLVIVLIFAVRRLYIPRRGFGRVDLLYQVAAAVGVGWLAALSVDLFCLPRARTAAADAGVLGAAVDRAGLARRASCWTRCCARRTGADATWSAC